MPLGPAIFPPRHCFDLDALEARRLRAAVAGSLDAGKTIQTIDSFGATSIAWQNSPEDKNASMYDAIVNDLGASGARGAVWPMFEKANDNTDPNVFNWAKFDSSQLAHVLQFDQRMKERGVTKFFLSVWTPPAWMKTNRSLNGGGFLRPDMRAEFAEYLAAVVIAAKRDFNVEIAAISIQNEPFFPEGYESTMYDAVSMRETLIAVQKKFAFEHLSTKIIANEDVTLADTTRWKWFNTPVLDDDEIDRSRLIIGAHYPQPPSLTPVGSQIDGTGIPLWYSEIGGKNGEWSGGIESARDMSDILTRSNASAVYLWTFNNETTDAPLSQTHSLMANGVPNGKFYALKHYFKYIRPGMQRLQTTIDESSGSRLTAFKDPATGAATIVVVNESSSSNVVTINLKGLATGTTLRGFLSTASVKWQSLGTVNASGTTLTITVPASGVITLTNVADVAPITGVGSPPLTIGNLSDGVLGNDLRRNVMYGNLSAVQSLIAGGANVNAADPVSGWTPLHAAAAGVFPQAGLVLDALLAAGANVNAKDVDGFTPLHVAAMNQMLEYTVALDTRATMVGKLISAGANVNAKDNAGRTPLMWSALTPAPYEQKSGIVGVPLTMMTNVAVPDMLISKGATKSLTDNAGRTAYDYAVQEYKQPFLSMLSSVNDTRGPQTRQATYSTLKNFVSIVVTEDVRASFDAGDVKIVNRQTNQTFPIGSLTEVFSSGLTIAHANFASRLPNGHYRMTIAAGAFSDPNGKLSTAITVDFDSLNGDITGDGVVNFDDLVVLSQNYNQTGLNRLQGDLTDDGVVNFDDLVVLSQNYNGTIPPLTAITAPANLKAAITKQPAATKERIRIA